jgi:hypothetical protein
MGTITTIGLDIAKSVFQVHGIDATGEVVVRRRLSRGRILAFSRNTWPDQPAEGRRLKRHLPTESRPHTAISGLARPARSLPKPAPPSRVMG